MFDAPLPIVRDSVYEQLGLGPEATTDEVREATLELIVQLKADRQEVDKQLARIHEAIPGLQEASEAVKRLASESQDTAAQELIQAEKALLRLEQRAVAFEPAYRRLLERGKSLDERILEVNRMALQNPEERQSYDRLHPPFELLKLEECSRNELSDNAACLDLLRRELTSWISERGEEVFHPSDLTRTDFTGDLTRHPLLDGAD